LETQHRTNARCACNQKKQKQNIDTRAKDDDKYNAESKGKRKRVT
jgi:hypothetical protein